jgi:hypothetical protein
MPRERLKFESYRGHQFSIDPRLFLKLLTAAQ